MTDSICIISCGNTKIWKKDPNLGKVKAKDAYIGGLFKKNRAFAEKFFPEWYILSDHYGLITPDIEIEDYNIPPSAVKGNLRFLAIVMRQREDLNLNPAKVVTTTGSIHYEIIKRVFFETDITNPLAGMSQGKRMKELNNLMNTDPSW